jgi:hypothetical protein
MRPAGDGGSLTCLMAALKAPRMAAAPPQSRFIPGMVVCSSTKGPQERVSYMELAGSSSSCPDLHSTPGPHLPQSSCQAI